MPQKDVSKASAKARAVGKKRKEATATCLQVLNDLESTLVAAAERLRGGQSVRAQLEGLGGAVGSGYVTRVKTAHRTLHAAMSKLDKSMDKVNERGREGERREGGGGEEGEHR